MIVPSTPLTRRVRNVVGRGNPDASTMSTFRRFDAVPTAPTGASMRRMFVLISETWLPTLASRTFVARMSPPVLTIEVVPTGFSIVPLIHSVELVSGSLRMSTSVAAPPLTMLNVIETLTFWSGLSQISGCRLLT